MCSALKDTILRFIDQDTLNFPENKRFSARSAFDWEFDSRQSNNDSRLFIGFRVINTRKREITLESNHQREQA